MQFEFDEAKRLPNIAKRGLDFLGAGIRFAGALLTAPAQTVADEDRWLAVGLIEDVHVTAIFTRRGIVIRLISVRRARNDQRDRYQALLGN